MLLSGGILDWCAPPKFWTTNAIPNLCSFHCFTKLKTKSFVTRPFIGFGMSPWLLGTDSGGTFQENLLNTPQKCYEPQNVEAKSIAKQNYGMWTGPKKLICIVHFLDSVFGTFDSSLIKLSK